jgi:DUF4097 and DUF4098 domain-containing protein YvlB
MKAITKLQLLTLSMLLLPGLSAVADSGATDTFEENLTVADAITLDVKTGSGSIEISSGPGRDVTIVGKIKVQRSSFWRRVSNADEIIQQVIDNPPIEVSDGLVRVGRFEDRSLGKRVSISYKIVVPADSGVLASTGSGSISVNDIAAHVNVGSGSGRLKLANIGGYVEASAGSGSIRAEKVAGGFKASTGSGSIYLSQTAPGDVSVSTGSGSTELTGIAGSLKAKAGSGRITVDGRQEGDWKIDSGSGSIRVSLPDDAAFELDAESNSGGIVVDHPLTIQGKASKRHLRGEVRGGGPLLKIDTGSGGIRVE